MPSKNPIRIIHQKLESDCTS